MPHAFPYLEIRDAEALGRLWTTRQLLQRQIERPPGARDLARIAGLSPFHFVRVFKKTFGQTPHRLTTELRLAHARTLLRETDLPVTEICFECGYESLGSFSLLFRKEVGCSPREYRQSRRRFWPVNIAFLRSFVPFCIQDGARGWPGE